MPAKNPRVMVVLEQPLYRTICRKAKRDGVSLSTEMRDLVRLGLDDQEDIGWTRAVDDRLAQKKLVAPVSHNKFWKKLGL